MIKQKKLKMHGVKTIVLDEGDQLLIPEHMATVGTILHSARRDRQVLLFSATLPKQLEEEASHWMNEPVSNRISKEEAVQTKDEHI